MSERPFLIALEEHTKLDTERFQEINEKLDDISRKIDPLIDVYKAVLLSKSFVAGLGAIIVSIGAIGAGIVWLVNHAIQK